MHLSLLVPGKIWLLTFLMLANIHKIAKVVLNLLCVCAGMLPSLTSVSVPLFQPSLQFWHNCTLCPRISLFFLKIFCFPPFFSLFFPLLSCAMQKIRVLVLFSQHLGDDYINVISFSGVLSLLVRSAP